MDIVKTTGLVIALTLTGCAGMNAALTPSAKVEKAQFDGATRVTQEPVSAANGMGEGWNMLGMVWNSKSPDVVYVQAGLYGISAINELAFSVDGEIKSFREPFELTSFDRSYQTVSQSFKSYAVPLDYLRKLAAADVVQLRITTLDHKFSDSSFGRKKTGAVFSGKLVEFLAKIEQVKG